MIVCDATWFRRQLIALGLSQTGYARLLKALGDPRTEATLRNYVQRVSSGEFPVDRNVPLITMLIRSPPSELIATQRSKRRACAGS